MFDNVRKELKPAPSKWMGDAAILVGKIGDFALLLIFVIGIVFVGAWKANDGIVDLQNQISSSGDKKYHCPACGVTAPAGLDTCASYGLGHARIDGMVSAIERRFVL